MFGRTLVNLCTFSFLQDDIFKILKTRKNFKKTEVVKEVEKKCFGIKMNAK